MLIGYGRVSTSHQDLELQKAKLLEAGCEQVFLEKQSGSVTERHELKQAMSYLRCGDTLVVWRLDRLARSLKHLIDIIDQLNSKGAYFTSLSESIDTHSPTGRFTLNIFGALAEFERSLIRERTQAGLDHARRQGRVGGRPRMMTENKITMAKSLLSDGKLSAKQVAHEMGVSRSTLYRWIEGGRTACR